MNPSDSPEQLDVLTKRLEVLRYLCEGPAQKRTLVAELSHSRSTINRAIRELEDANFVKRSGDGLTATVAGRLAAAHLVSFRNEFDDIVTADEVVNPLPVDAPLTIEAIAGSDAMLATEPVPYRPLEGVHDALTEADRYRAILPTLDDPRHVRLLYEHVVTDADPAELVVTPSLLDTLQAEFPRQLAGMADYDQFRLLVTETPPPFALCLADSDGETTVSVVVFADGGTVHGVLRNGTGSAVAWATSQYEAVRADARERTQ